jgi:hypothetical protein
MTIRRDRSRVKMTARLVITTPCAALSVTPSPPSSGPAHRPELRHPLCFSSSSGDPSLSPHPLPPGHPRLRRCHRRLTALPCRQPTAAPTFYTRRSPEFPITIASDNLGNPNLDPWHCRRRPALIRLPVRQWRPLRRLVPPAPSTASASAVSPPLRHRHGQLIFRHGRRDGARKEELRGPGRTRSRANGVARPSAQ